MKSKYWGILMAAVLAVCAGLSLFLMLLGELDGGGADAVQAHARAGHADLAFLRDMDDHLELH